MSRALQGLELNYLILEKLVPALIYVAKRFERYFQAHKIEVLTEYPRKQILLRPKRSGNLVKWAIELGDHDIDYRSCIGFKAQALADFLVEIPNTLNSVPTVLPIDLLEPEVSRDVWELHTDGATRKEGSRAGLILKNPNGDEIMYALRFNF